MAQPISPNNCSGRSRAGDLGEIVDAIVRFNMQLAISWFDNLAVDHLSLMVVLISLALTVGAIVIYRVLRTASGTSSSRQYLVLAVIGVGLAELGFLPYLASPNHRIGYFQTVHFASLGAAITCASLCGLLSRRVIPRIDLGLVLAGAFLLMASVHGLQQQAQAIADGLPQQQLLAKIVEEVGTPTKLTYVVVVDEAHTQLYDWLFNWNLTAFSKSLRYLYKDESIDGIICPPSGEVRKPIWEGVSETCSYDDDAIRVRLLDNEGNLVRMFASPYSNMLILRHTLAGDTRLLTTAHDLVEGADSGGVGGQYQPALRRVAAITSPRIPSMFNCWPIESCAPTMADAWPSEDSVRIELDADSLAERPHRGWGGPEGVGEGLTTRWSVDKAAAVSLKLRSGPAYFVRARLIGAAAPDILASLRVRYDGQDIAAHQVVQTDGAVIVEGVIPAELVGERPRLVELEFITNRTQQLGTDPRTLGLVFDWISVDPPETAVKLEFDADSLTQRPYRGWAAAESDADGVTYRWTLEPTSAVGLRLAPGSRYLVRARVLRAAAPDILAGLRLAV